MPIDHIVRRMVVGLIALVLFVHGLAAQPPSPQSPEPDPHDWPFFLGPTGDSKSTETGIRIDWSRGGLPVRWTRQLGESYGIGTVYQDRYYQFDGRRWCFAFARGGLVGFEPSTGKVDFHYPWRVSLVESVHASVPVVVDDQVFISEAYGPGSSLLKVHPGGYQVLRSDPPRSRRSWPRADCTCADATAWCVSNWCHNATRLWEPAVQDRRLP